MLSSFALGQFFDITGFKEISSVSPTVSSSLQLLLLFFLKGFATTAVEIANPRSLSLAQVARSRRRGGETARGGEEEAGRKGKKKKKE